MTTSPSFDTVTANHSITVKNASTADGTSDISIGGNGLFMGTKKITGLAAGTDTTDAVNFGRLSAVSSNLSTFENKTIQVAATTVPFPGSWGKLPSCFKAQGPRPMNIIPAGI